MRRVLVGVDGSEAAARAVQLARALFICGPALLELTLVHVVSPDAWPRALEGEAEAQLAQGLTRFGSTVAERAAGVARGPGVLVRPQVAIGPPAETLRRAAPLLAPGGRTVVSEPPMAMPDRWPEPLLERLGLERVPFDDDRVAIFRRVECFT